ncbi:MAG: hypothetical protein NTW06_03020, partial [Candidatus Falkowbacteria bacterium]|nr:hypothetical protein [Candidatus Falkowbacteria bacterium]
KSFYIMAKQILEEIFYVLTGALVIFVIMEIVWSGIVLAYININWVLIFWLINVILLLTNKKEIKGN